MAGNCDVDVIHTYPRTRTGRRIHGLGFIKQLHQVWQLRRARYDVAIAAGGEASHRAIARLAWLNARMSIAFVHAGDPMGRRITHPLVPDSTLDNLHESERIAQLLKPLLTAANPSPPLLPLGWPHYCWPPVGHTEALKELEARGVSCDRYWVLGIGARRAKRQPSVAQILELAAIAWDLHGLATVFMWTPGASDDPLYPGDDAIADAVLAAGRPYIIPFRGAIAGALGYVARARTSCFPDSGLMHFAAASQGGVVGLFADVERSPHPTQWGPRGARTAIVIAERSIAELPVAALTSALTPFWREPNPS
jgi:heptosyltransferase III